MHGLRETSYSDISATMDSGAPDYLSCISYIGQRVWDDSSKTEFVLGMSAGPIYSNVSTEQAVAAINNNNNNTAIPPRNRVNTRFFFARN